MPEITKIFIYVKLKFSNIKFYKNLAIANRSRVSSTHNRWRASI